ncbi:MAG TPA: rhodoquinone biosynthesis methyltransferase RquA, partial [Usitatibacteraceae bacterium]|nr:rhodoquinone biosynthesis methyltransferase RquA [Usitatibacteraceae bacterium]
MPRDTVPIATENPGATAIPAYLEETYWWAYVHPKAVSFFERQWLVNAILWGNFPRLRDAALESLGGPLDGQTLQVACVYGDFTLRLAERIAADGWLDVVDVLPIQLKNLREKLPAGSRVREHLGNSAALHFADASFERTVLFFLLHEQPEHVRRATLAEAIRVTKPGGKVVVVDYHLPKRFHPLRYLFRPVLGFLEPFALDLWRSEVE